MREVKYRAWDTVKNEWIDLESDHYGLDNEGNLVLYYVSTGELDYEIVKNAMVVYFTGLCDKNGKDIYEGDIIIDNDGFLWIVYFEDGMYCAKGGKYETVKYLIEFCPKWCEVIGNIYEYSHLLKTEN